MGKTQLGKLQRAQNKAIRAILYCDRYTKTKHMLRVLQFIVCKTEIIL